MSLLEKVLSEIEKRSLTISGVEQDLGFGNGSIRRWGNSIPSIDKVAKLANLLNVSLDSLMELDNSNSPLSKDELELLGFYKDLNNDFKVNALYRMVELAVLNNHQGEFKELLNSVLTLIDINHTLEKDSKVIVVDFEKPAIRTIPVYSQAASAGTGNFLSSEDYDLIDFDVDILPIQTTFGVRLIGDSMEDKYSSGDVVFVKQQPDLESGQLGVFLLNGDALFKKYYISGNKTSLKSLNNSYPPIRIKESDDLRLIGRVLGSNHDID